MKKGLFLLIIISSLVSKTQKSFCQLAVTDNQTAQALVDRLTGDGVITLNSVLNCPALSNGVFTVTGTSNLGIDSGIVLTSGRAMTNGSQIGVNAPYNGGNTSLGTNAPGDPDLTALAGQATHDRCVLEFDFVPAGDTIKFEYVFGSAEYLGFSCSSFNDAFGFFVTGPGIVGQSNIATIPGTNVPITVNSTTGLGNGPMCTNIAPGSPFSQYFVNNNGGTSISYSGFTTIFTAISAVNACDTYHLKLAIADAADGSLDSGVFLKAGSLSSTSISVKTYGGAGLTVPYTNTVRGCPPGKVVIKRSSGFNQPITVPLTYSGTAINGVDYVTLPNSVTIPAGDSVVSLYVNGIPMPAPVGVKTCIISALSPYVCASGDTVVLSSDTINIYDSIYVNILNPDTTICAGESVSIQTEADSLLNFSWSPFLTVDNPTAQNVVVTPTETTTYTVSVSLDVITACPPSTDNITITVKDTPIIDLGPDIAVCGTAVQLNAETQPYNPDETFNWTPPNGLSDPNIRNPIATPSTNTEYIVTVNAGVPGCESSDTILIRMLPDHITVLNNDTVLCAGSILPLRVEGDSAFSYIWNPEQDIADPFSTITTLTARESGYYTITASFPGCDPMADSVYVEVQPVPAVDLGGDRIICSYDTIQFLAAVTPAYPNYSYDWSPGIFFSDSSIGNPIFRSGATTGMRVKVEVKTPHGCSGSDSIQVIVNPGDFLTVSPRDTLVCPPAELQLYANGGESYTWLPSWGLSDTSISNPIATPISSTEYELVSRNRYHCFDTQKVIIIVAPGAVIDLVDEVMIWPGETYQINPQGNGLYFSWFPPSGLSADNISNPIASPDVRTRYFVTSTTENGCYVKDSIDILVNNESVLDLPNAFTPGNGINGEYKIVRRGNAKLKYFRIFNRWGNIVFETTNVDQGWDGKFKEKPQPMGVYLYTIEAETPSGKTWTKNGNLTLIR